jgi:hypothetical protein
MQVFIHTSLVWRPKKLILAFIGDPVSNKDKLRSERERRGAPPVAGIVTDIPAIVSK